MTVLSLSRDLPLAGTVRNVPDGSVELLVQGPSEDIETLLQRLFEHFGAFIRNVNRSTSVTRKLSKGIRVTG